MGAALSSDGEKTEPVEEEPRSWILVAIIGFVSLVLYHFFFKRKSSKSILTEREQILESVSQLFLFTDEKRWDELEDQVLGEKVYLDMSTLGLQPVHLTASQLCGKWKDGASKIDSVFHSCSNHHVKIDGKQKTAIVKCCATTTHYKASAIHGMSRDFVGTYELKLAKEKEEWRVTAFKFDLFFMLGNGNLE